MKRIAPVAAIKKGAPRRGSALAISRIAQNCLGTQDTGKVRQWTAGKFPRQRDLAASRQDALRKYRIRNSTLRITGNALLSSRPEHCGVRLNTGLNAVRQAARHCEEAAGRAELCFPHGDGAARGSPRQKTRSASVVSPQPNAKRRLLDSPIVANWTGTHASLLRSTVTDTFFEGFYPSLIKLADSLFRDIKKSLSSA
jgi:hypothetical protein